MRPTEPLPLHHSWPLFERDRLFDLGHTFGCPPSTLSTSDSAWPDRQELTRYGIGQWECDLSDDSLAWSAEVYDIFGLPRDSSVQRDEVVGLYRESSRAVMERLRAYAIKHRRGFTLDAEIQSSSHGHPQWMRLIAAPLCEGGRVVRLRGLKRII